MGEMSEELASLIRQAGNNLPAIKALYDAPGAGNVDREPIRDRRYGDHPRHLLDLYLPEGEAPPAGWPVLAFFHGGGFIRGNKEHRANIGHFFAQHGFITVLANYRLAPEVRWPGGAEDVVRVWHWLQAEVATYQGDPQRVALMGESAGAAHVAAATLRAEFHPDGWRIAGAALLSGPYNSRLEGLAPDQFGIEQPDPRNEPYFGPDKSLWDAASTVDHVSASPFPLLIGFTEQDLLQMQVQAGELFARLVSRHGFRPDLLHIPRHNHFSQGYSIGTEDTSVSAPLLQFLQRIT